MRLIALAALSMILLTACQTSKTVTPLRPTYQYTAYDAKGSLVLTGTLHIDQVGNKVTGDWALEPADQVKPADIGPQVGTGILSGSTQDNVTVINLHPQTIDNHVILRGSLRNGIFSGAWQYIGFGGVVSEGSFSAIAQ